MLALVWNSILAGMVGYFALSLVEALAIQEARRQHEVEIRRMDDDPLKD